MQFTIEQQNKAFDAAKKELLKEIDAKVPAMFKGYVHQYLTDKMILDVVEAALKAI